MSRSWRYPALLAVAMALLGTSQGSAAILSGGVANATVSVSGRDFGPSNSEFINGPSPLIDWTESVHSYSFDGMAPGWEAWHVEYSVAPEVLLGGGASVGAGFDSAGVRFVSPGLTAGVIGPDIIWGTSVRADYTLTDEPLVSETVVPMVHAPIFGHLAPGHRAIISVEAFFRREVGGPSGILYLLQRSFDIDTPGDFAFTLEDPGGPIGGFGTFGLPYSLGFSFGAIIQDVDIVGGESWVSLGTPLTTGPEAFAASRIEPQVFGLSLVPAQAAMPEPGALVLLGLCAGLGLVGYGIRRRRAAA